MAEKRTIKLVGGPRGDVYCELRVEELDDTIMLPVCYESGVALEVYKRVGESDFEYVPDGG